MNKRRRVTTINFSRSIDEDPSSTTTPLPLTSSSSTTERKVLFEKTTVASDGRLRRERGLVALQTLDDHRPTTQGDVPRVADPIYELYSGVDPGDVVDEGDEIPRDLRPSDNPLAQWTEDLRQIYLEEILRLEGRGDHTYSHCRRCGDGSAEFRCCDCLGGGELLCAACTKDGHQQMPFHRIQQWTGTTFRRITLKQMGLRIQLGHWHSPRGTTCPLPEAAAGDDFVIVDNLGVHHVALDYCGCGQGGLRTVQLLRAQIWGATTTNPRTGATFSVLRRFQLLSCESKCSVLEFYQTLARETDNLHFKKDTVRYNEFMRMTREWRNIRMLKRAGRGHESDGIAKTEPGACALLCPACPHPGKNLPPNWENASPESQFIYALFVAIDANFRLKRKDVSTEERDPGLGNGWAFMCDVNAYMEHVRKHWNFKQDRSHCVAHDAVDKPDREARGTASSGIGAVDCARHNMKRPCAVGDLQLGERYINMDYMFFRSIAGSSLTRFVVSYDIACQWHIHLLERLTHYNDDALSMDGTGKFITFLVPKFHLPAHIEDCNLKFSFNLTRDVGQTDGEAPERGWADANPMARSTKEMGPGFRRDTLDDYFNDVNHKKIIALGYTLRRKVERAVPEMVRTREAWADMDESVGSAVVETWTAMAVEWEADVDAPNPFATIHKDKHIAKVREELAAEAAQREQAGMEDQGAIRGDMHITELIAMGLQLEHQQRILASDVASTGLHPTDGQRRAMTERTSKLRRKIVAWIDIQTKFFPGLAHIREKEDEARRLAATAKRTTIPGVAVPDITLWLPSAIIVEAGGNTVRVEPKVFEHEYRLRVGQASEALHEVRRLLLVRTHLYKLKDAHSRGVRANTRSNDKITALNEQVKRAAATYRVARMALVYLGRELGRKEWEWTLQELREEDVRGLPQAMFHDPERKKRKRKKSGRKEARPLSWIWMARGEKWNPGDDVAMNEAVRIEWAKTRARALRWQEEVTLLEEEMRRTLQYLQWRSDWWKQQIGRRGLADGPQLEGETSYALRQAAIQSTLAEGFTKEWRGLDELIRGGRAGELVDGAGEAPGTAAAAADSDEESEEEDEAILALPARPINPSYTDEILTM
ncbi:hypothetical protein R3P38DRAFT_2529348 [Favolaschia claudopus]|uniref:CxC2-like cysteine cluster KDZ transposase-associated domain-containing protein n=1 Tax=Favolaschia claudopus TaxID=2862362 RepID=A0AAW0BHY1_9AGAR